MLPERAAHAAVLDGSERVGYKTEEVGAPMTDFKIRPDIGLHRGAVERTERPDAPSRPFQTAAPDTRSSVTGASDVSEPSALVEEIRAGRLDVDRAVEILIDQVIHSLATASVPDAVRADMRRTLVELVREDPTLADLASAMKR
jgi:hypothetical protein